VPITNRRPAWAFNPEQGRKLLAEAGFPAEKGSPVSNTRSFSGAGGGGKMPALVAVEFAANVARRARGSKSNCAQIERKVFYSAQSRLDFDLSSSSWIGDYNDANTFLDIFMSNSGNNRTGWKNPRYDELIHQANMQTDLNQRAELFREAERKF